ncbi:MAG: hypothetical protein Alis3KO_15450 [Aliiglaciecola sp.]
MSETQESQSNQSQWSFAEKLNLLIAVCAILISAASFYATFLQADAAEKQVRAATWPMLEYGHGNAAEGSFKPLVYLEVVNGGVGPAHIQTFTYHWKEKTYTHIGQLLKDCCFEAGQEINKLKSEFPELASQLITAGISINPHGRVLSSGNKIKVFQLPENKITAPLWNKLNQVRWEITASTCYCSVLEDCYKTDFESPPTQVSSCKVD